MSLWDDALSAVEHDDFCGPPWHDGCRCGAARNAAAALRVLRDGIADRLRDVAACEKDSAMATPGAGFEGGAYIAGREAALVAGLGKETGT